MNEKKQKQAHTAQQNKMIQPIDSKHQDST